MNMKFLKYKEENVILLTRKMLFTNLLTRKMLFTKEKVNHMTVSGNVSEFSIIIILISQKL